MGTIMRLVVEDKVHKKVLRRKDASGDDQELVNSNTITLILLLDIPGGEYEKRRGRKMDTIFSVVLLPN